jgi:3-hydroxyacyl-[acyl-carrier-protein] dehydratase
MLLLDEAAANGDEAVASYSVRGDEYFLQGHFPGAPVVPGVILCEMMGQAACILIMETDSGATIALTGMDKIKFKNKVIPGEKIIFKCRIVKSRPPFYFVKCEGFVNDKLCVGGEMSLAKGK